MEFYCPYCRAWIDDTIHAQHHHNDLDTPDKIRDDRERWPVPTTAEEG